MSQQCLWAGPASQLCSVAHWAHHLPPGLGTWPRSVQSWGIWKQPRHCPSATWVLLRAPTWRSVRLEPCPGHSCPCPACAGGRWQGWCAVWVQTMVRAPLDNYILCIMLLIAGGRGLWKIYVSTEYKFASKQHDFVLKWNNTLNWLIVVHQPLYRW